MANKTNRFFSSIIFLILYAAFTSNSAQAKNYPDYKNLFVNDVIGLLSEVELSQIKQRLKKYYNDTGVQISLVIIQSRSDYDSSSSIESFTTGLFNDLGIGNAETNNAVLILVSKNDREIRIELGAGYDSQLDSLMKTIIDNVIIPYFKINEYVRGIKLGIESIIVGLNDPLGNPLYIEPSPQIRGAWSLATLPIWIYIVIAILLLLGSAFWIKHYLRKRPRNCRKCATPMQRLNELQDDQYLDEGNLIEEAVKSVDYDVWHCNSCGHNVIKRYAKLFSGYGACPDCNYKTLESDSTTISVATEYSEGEMSIEYECEHCDYENTEYQTIPRITRSSSRSSNSSGVGSSSGGGASGSW